MNKCLDLIIQPKWIIPIVPNGVILENHGISIKNGVIQEILPIEAFETYETQESIQLPSHALLPGLVNAHAHSPMTLLRGLADDLPLMDWLNNHIWPAEQAFLAEDFMVDGTQLAIAEMIRSGTTCFNEHYLFPEVSAQATIPTGMRAGIGLHVFNVPTPWASTMEERFRKGLKAYESYKDEPLLSFSMAPHAPYTVDDETFLRVKAISEENNLPIHLHLHETADEISMSMGSYGKRPIERLHALGLLSDRFQAVHMTQLTDSDIELLQKTGTHVTTCPESNLKLVSGFCPVQSLLDAGVNVSLATDGAASNNDLDMFSEMRTMALLEKAVSKNPMAVSAEDALQIATLNGAKAMGLADKIGSIEPGKLADVIAVDFDSFSTQPIYNPISHLVYAMNSQQVSDVWVAGKRLLENKRLTTLNEADILEKAKAWKARIKHRQKTYGINVDKT